MAQSGAQGQKIGAGEPLMAVPADTIVPELTRAEFAAGWEGCIEIIGPGELALPPVSCHGIAPDDVVIQRPLNMPPQPPGFLTKIAYPRHAICRVKDALCLPGGVAIAQEQNVLLESFSAPWEADYHNALEQVEGGWRPRESIAAIEVLEGPALFADYQHSAFFGHFIADALSRGWAVDYCRAWLGTEIRQALITAPVPPYISAMLGALGIRAVPLPMGQAVRCQELIVATKAFQIQEYISPPAFSLWHRLKERLAVPGNWPARVYVSRRRNPTRRLVEEEQVEAFFAQRGFTIFYPEAHDVATQVSVFAAARMIAGCSGSNMFNIAFHSPGAAILILVSPLLIHYSEHFFSAGSAVRLSYFPGYVTEAQMAQTPGYVHAPWHVDVAALQSYVDEWIAG